jgi:hypothetical protein
MFGVVNDAEEFAQALIERMEQAKSVRRRS